MSKLTKKQRLAIEAKEKQWKIAVERYNAAAPQFALDAYLGDWVASQYLDALTRATYDISSLPKSRLKWS